MVQKCSRYIFTTRENKVNEKSRKADTQALEGIFSCNYHGTSSVPVGIYYPSKKFHCVIVRVILLPLYEVSSMSARIEAVNRRNSTFKVICTAIGGRTLTIDITGPDGAVAIYIEF